MKMNTERPVFNYENLDVGRKVIRKIGSGEEGREVRD